VILLDASGSIGDDNFRLAKEYVARLASAFTVTVQNKIGFSTFANSVQTIFNLTTPFNPDQIESWILNAPYTSGGTQTNLAIDAGTQHSSQVGRGVPQNIVVITDGQSTDPAKTEAAANQALAKGIRMFAVGITNRVNHEELQKITGYDGKRVFTAETWDDLIQLLAPVSVQICPDP
jgi:collagen type VI alpha